MCLSKPETNALLAHFDTNADGCVNFDAFLACLRGCLSDGRQAIVDSAWAKYANGCGRVCSADLRVAFGACNHPRVASGEITEDEAFLEFLANFGDKRGDGYISKQEWYDYYSAVSAAVASDDHFSSLMCGAWGL